MSDPTERSQAADDLKALLQEAEQALSNSADVAGDKFDELRGRLRDALESGRYSLDRLRSEAAARAKQADQLVRDHPIMRWALQPRLAQSWAFCCRAVATRIERPRRL